MSEYLDDTEFKTIWFFDNKVNYDTLQCAKACGIVRHEDHEVPVVADLSFRHRGPGEDQYNLEVLAEYEIPFFGQKMQVVYLLPREKVQTWIEALPDGSPYPFRLRRELQA